jgi:putative Ca2+/H+ antiporter (TMEM165/GDT1 family)
MPSGLVGTARPKAALSMNLGLSAAVFGIILIAELPDKTMFASLLLSTRFAARWVFLGAAAAFVVHVTIAVTAGSLLGLLPKKALDFIVAALFLTGATYLYYASRQAEEEPEEEAETTAGARTITAAVASSFGVIFVGEWGDITQIATANLAAKYHDPLAVGLGATLGLWAAALIAITAGRSLLKVLSVRLLHRIGAVIFAALAVYSLVQAIRA